jgi:hypothetical protein
VARIFVVALAHGEVVEVEDRAGRDVTPAARVCSAHRVAMRCGVARAGVASSVNQVGRNAPAARRGLDVVIATAHEPGQRHRDDRDRMRALLCIGTRHDRSALPPRRAQPSTWLRAPALRQPRFLQSC